MYVSSMYDDIKCSFRMENGPLKYFHLAHQKLVSVYGIALVNFFCHLFCFPPSLFSNVTFPYFSEDRSRWNCYFCLFSSHRCITVCKCFVSITFNTIVIMICFPHSNAKHRLRSVKFPENKKRLVLYHFSQGKGLIIDRNSTALSSY